MAGRYDEDVYKNPYFSRILNEYPSYVERTVTNKGILCVPKHSIASNWSPSQTDIEDHVLLPTNDVVNDDEEFITVSNKVVHIADGKLVPKSGFTMSKQVTVLFAETFHADSGESYRIFCIDGLLNTSEDSPVSDDSTKNIPPASYKECLDLLWSHPGANKTRDSLDKVLNTLAVTYSRLEGETLRSIVDAANTHFTRAMQLLLNDSVMRRSVQQNTCYMDNVKVAVETYVMNSVHKYLFPVITATMAGQDAEINKINRNLVDLQPSDLGIRKIFSQNIPPAKKELNSVNLYSTPLERLLCLKRTVAALTKPPKSAIKENIKDSVTMMSTDDLLPILIFLIVKAEVPNWMANLVYMQHFHFSKLSDDDEFGFYLASVEAALEHIRSGNITNEIKPLKRDRWNSIFISDPVEGSMPSIPRSISRQISYSPLDEFFRLVREGDLAKLEEVLQEPHRKNEEVHRKMCHPLCSCDECDKLLSHFRSNSDLVTVYSRDSRGYTAMHIAAYYGQESLIDLLIQNNAIVDTTDYLGLSPLHLACQRGLLNVILHLLHFGADVVATDSEGNTPLHFCCANGHEECVKTLISHEAILTKLEINLANEFGDTALHLAAKWGYESIVNMLLEKGADPTLCNKRKHTPVSLAQNVRVQRWLQLAAQASDSQASDPQAADIQHILGVPATPESASSTNSASSALKVPPEQSEDMLDIYNPESSGHVQAALLEAVTESHETNQEEKLFKSITEGDIHQVQLFLGMQDDVGYGEDDDFLVSPSSFSLCDMCHPLCQCDKCLLIQKADLMTRNRVNVNSKSLSGFHPIHAAVLHKHSDIVDLLISCNADINVQNRKDLTPLHLACCVRSLVITDVLVKAGARLNVCDTDGNTPLMVAACNGFVDGVRTLLEVGANLNSRNHKGNTALHEALKRDDSEISAILVKAGADPRIRNKLGKLSLDETDDAAMRDMLTDACNQMDEAESNADNNNVPRKQDTKGCDGQITIQELFAAFEEKDLHRLRNLALSIRSFDQKSGLRSTMTRDRSAPYLNLLA